MSIITIGGRSTIRTQNTPGPILPLPNNNGQTSDFWFVNSSYLRLKTASLGYTIPTHISSKVSHEKCTNICNRSKDIHDSGS